MKRMTLLMLTLSLAAMALAGGQTPGCGIERWAVKTLSDNEAVRLDTTTVTKATIQTLATTPPRSPWKHVGPLGRVTSGVYDETVVVEVVGRLVLYKTEADHDYHVVLADSTTARTMIVEVVDPTCPGAATSRFVEQFRSVRSQFETLAKVHVHGLKYRWKSGPMVVVRGVRFFDPIHGQTGVALNGVELHPVLQIEAAK